MSRPIAVLISDVHYNVHTLPLADAAMRQAIAKANELKVPLVVAGDLHDTKANMRAECVNAMLETFSLCETECFILRGNHDAINEKSEEHSLNFLAKETVFCHDYDDEDIPAIYIIDKPQFTNSIAVNMMSVHLIPYQHDPEVLKAYLKKVDKGSTIIMHQGLKEANAGDYIQDKSALTYDDVKDFRVISGHYHTRQNIKTGRPRMGAVGLFSYIGNPFTLGFGEANDPLKGFQILMNDGTLEFIPTNLRKHVILNVEFVKDNFQITGKVPIEDIRKDDLVWVKVTGAKEELLKIDKAKVAKLLDLTQDLKLDLIPTNTETQLSGNSGQLTQGEILDELIDSLSATSDERKTRLKELWKAAACG